jgi:hypothetical protein
LLIKYEGIMSTEHSQESLSQSTATNRGQANDNRLEPSPQADEPTPNADPAASVKSKPSTARRLGQNESPAEQVSKASLELQSRLPALEDDADIGAQKEYVVTRDGKADLRFSGVLMASAAPATAPEGRWNELRVYKTVGGKHVFSRITRSVLQKDQDTHEADVYDPVPSSVPSQLMRSAREMARHRPFAWTDAAVAFFGYDPLAKILYRKLSVNFEEKID